MTEIYWPSFFFLLFAALACAFAVAVVISSNIVRMAFYLVLSLGATAVLFFQAGADFVGAMQLMIYVGGTLVLLIFGVMLTAQGPFISMKTRGGEWILAAIVGGSLLAVLLPTAFSIEAWAPLGRDEVATTAPPTATRLGMGFLGARVDKPNAPGYLLPFEIISIHLLIVLVGAAYLARSKRRNRQSTADSR